MVGVSGEVSRRERRGGGGVRAIVAGCNQSSANTATHSHTYIHQR